MFSISSHELTDILIKLGMAFFVGGIVGAEREYKNKTAGFRTLILICTGAMLFTVLAVKMDITNSARIIANIVVGIGFLGGGVIFKDESKVTGITTASIIWVTAALGVCIGLGYYILAIIFMISIIIVLLLFSRIEYYIDNNHQIKQYEIYTMLDTSSIHFIEQQAAAHQLKISNKTIRKENEKMIIIICLIGSPASQHLFADDLLRSSIIVSFKC